MPRQIPFDLADQPPEAGAVSTARPAVATGAGKQIRRRGALDDPVANPGEAIGVGDADEGGGEPLGGAGIELGGSTDGATDRQLSEGTRGLPQRQFIRLRVSGPR